MRVAVFREDMYLAQVEIYTQKICPYCAWAKSLLKSKGVEFQEIDVSFDRELRARMTQRAGGRYTVPEIFINGRIIGGFDELKALDDAGQLDALLAQPA